jgi:hypothetical protein
VAEDEIDVPGIDPVPVGFVVAIRVLRSNKFPQPDFGQHVVVRPDRQSQCAKQDLPAIVDQGRPAFESWRRRARTSIKQECNRRQSSQHGEQGPGFDENLGHRTPPVSIFGRRVFRALGHRLM